MIISKVMISKSNYATEEAQVVEGNWNCFHHNNLSVNNLSVNGLTNSLMTMTETEHISPYSTNMMSLFPTEVRFCKI